MAIRSLRGRRLALALACVAAVFTQGSFAKPRVAPKAGHTPLRFDPPAAGPAQRGNAGYDACIDQPSPDGASIDCQALATAAPTHPPKVTHRR
jgi:hypothetical protein